MNRNLTLIFILSMVTLFSCRSSQDLIYLNDSNHNEISNQIPIQTTEHILNSGDILYVSIKSMNPEVNILYNPESHMETGTGQGYQKYTTPSGAYLYGFEVDTDGEIKLPLLGKIKVAGIPLSQVESVVQKKTDEFLNDAIVKVKLLNFKVTVMGEVKAPGQYYNYNNSITVLQAIALANGNTDYASIKRVMVVRTIGDTNKTYMLDLSSKALFSSEAFYLQPNDYVFVQPDKHKNMQLNSQIYSIAISSLSVLIAVLAVLIN